MEKTRENVLKYRENPTPLKKSLKIIGRKLIISSSNKMKPQLNASKKIEPAQNFSIT